MTMLKEHRYMNDSKKVFIIISIMLIVFTTLVVSLNDKVCLGAENNLSISQEDELTRQYLREYDEETLAQQQGTLDFYRKQKELEDENEKLKSLLESMEENKKLHEILDTQEKIKKEIDFKEREQQIRAENERLASQTVAYEQERQIQSQSHPSTSKNIEEAGKQVVKETARVVQKANREVKRIIKKF